MVCKPHSPPSTMQIQALQSAFSYVKPSGGVVRASLSGRSFKVEAIHLKCEALRSRCRLLVISARLRGTFEQRDVDAARAGLDRQRSAAGSPKRKLLAPMQPQNPAVPVLGFCPVGHVHVDVVESL